MLKLRANETLQERDKRRRQAAQEKVAAIAVLVATSSASAAYCRHLAAKFR